MPHLNITNLHCVKKRDFGSKDELHIYFERDGGGRTYLSGPYHLDKSKNDDDVKLSEPVFFWQEVKIILVESNGELGGKDDLEIDSHTFDAGSPGDDYTFSSANGGVNYELTCSVSA